MPQKDKILVANGQMRIPNSPLFRQILVPAGADKADKKIVEQLGLGFELPYGMFDHLSVELELMAQFIEAEIGAQENEEKARAREGQSYIFSEHLGAWLPRFCIKLEEASSPPQGQPFFSSLASLTKKFIALEKQKLL